MWLLLIIINLIIFQTIIKIINKLIIIKIIIILQWKNRNYNKIWFIILFVNFTIVEVNISPHNHSKLGNWTFNDTKAYFTPWLFSDQFYLLTNYSSRLFLVIFLISNNYLLIIIIFFTFQYKCETFFQLFNLFLKGKIAHS